MKFKQFMEFAAFDFTMALKRVEKYMGELKQIEKNVDNPLYSFSKQKIGTNEQVFMTYWEALSEFRSVIQKYLHDGNILKALSPLYQKWRNIFEEMSQDENLRDAINHNRITTNLYLIYEIVEDMIKGRSPEPD